MVKNNQRYIQFYTPGTAAVKVEVQQEYTWAPLPEQKREAKMVIGVDPVAVFSFLVAVGLLILLVLGVNHLNQSRREVAALEHYAAQLTAQNHELTQTYQDGYRLDVIRRKAQEMGMVAAEEIPEKYIFVTVPPVETTPEMPTTWQQITTFLTGLFA